MSRRPLAVALALVAAVLVFATAGGSSGVAPEGCPAGAVSSLGPVYADGTPAEPGGDVAEATCQ